MLLFNRTERRLQESIHRYESDPHEALAFRIIKLWGKAGNWNEAFKWAKHARSSYPRSRYAVELYQWTKDRNARASLKKAKALAKANPTVENLVRLSEMLRIAGRSKQAFEAAQRAEEIGPDDWRVNLALGKLWFDSFSATRSEEHGWNAVEHLDSSRYANPNQYSTLLLLAIALARLNSFEDALTVTESALALVPGDRRALELDERIRRAIGKTSPGRAQHPGGQDGAAGAAYAQEEPLDRLLSLPGAVGAFEFNDRGKLVDYRARESARLFDFSVPSEVFERMAAACVLDTQRIGLGEFRSCSLSGAGWCLDYHAGGEHPMLVFFEGDTTGEQADAEIEAALGLRELAS